MAIYSHETIPLWMHVVYYASIWMFISLFHKKDRTAGSIAAASIIFICCLESLLQDIVGREAWIHYLSTHWIDAVWTVPIAILGLLYALLRLASFEKNQESGENDNHNDRSR